MAIQIYKDFARHCAVGILTLTVLGTGFVSCSDELDIPAPVVVDNGIEKGYLNIRLKCDKNVTRAEEPGVDNLNENQINSVTLCLSPSAGDRTDKDAPVFMHTFENLGANGEVMLRIPLTAELVTRLFNEDSSNTCRMFVAVNVDPGEAKTEADLRKLTVESTFASKMEQECFTMDGDAVMTYHPAPDVSSANAYGEVTVQRSASKITLALKVDSEVEEVVNGEKLIWTPNLTGMRVMLQQGVQTSTLDPKPEPNMPADVYFNTPNDLIYDFKEVSRSTDDPYAEYDREQEKPFYTYPNQWTGNPDERHGTFMMLSVPWSHDGGTTWRTCYYHVPIVKTDDFLIVRNHSYHIYLHVGVLGSFVPEEPLEIEGDYYVANWGQENIDVDIKDYRYLVVDQNNYVVNNENSTAIPFYTSHETVVTNVKMKFYRYNFSDQGSEFAVEVDKNQNARSLTDGGEAVYECEFDNENNILTLSHILDIWVPYNSSKEEVLLTRGLDKGAIENVRDANGRYFLDNTQALNNVLNSIAYFVRKEGDGEYSRIEYEVTVQHKDVFEGTAGIDPNLYKETVKITQYPGIYITAIQNYAERLSNRQYTPGAMGNTIINGRFDNTRYILPEADNMTNWPDIRKIIYNYRNWDYSLGLGFPPNYFNWNPNLYLVTITQLSPGTHYQIADPRSYNVNNYLANDDPDTGYTVDGGSDKVFASQYWYFGKGNDNEILEGSPYSAPRSYSTRWWEEYVLRGFITAPALNESQNRTLRYYYPTRESDDNKYTIAPKFRICSSYGGTSSFLTREMARRRAAAYQELGYCAGRWRLPTLGEVEFVIKLAADQKIPRLFGTTSSGTWFYWCAQGAVKVPDGSVENPDIVIEERPTGGASGNAVVPFTGNDYRDHARFVYDEWYWGDGTLTPSSATPNATSPTYTYTWGDRLKSNPIE